jgi:hypothetical protein
LEGQKAKVDRQKGMAPRGHASDFGGWRTAGDLIVVPSDGAALDQDIFAEPTVQQFSGTKVPAD